MIPLYLDVVVLISKVVKLPMQSQTIDTLYGLRKHLGGCLGRKALKVSIMNVFNGIHKSVYAYITYVL